MKIGNIVKPNKKGQIVIPRDLRKALGIKSDIALNIVKRGDGIFIYPIKEVITFVDSENSYYKILEKTKGKWKEDQKDWENLRKKRREIELKASKKRKKEW